MCPPATLIASFAAAARGYARSDRRPGLSCVALPAPIRATSRPKCSRTPAPSAVIVGHSERRQYHGETDARGARQGAGRAPRRIDGDRLCRRNPRRNARPGARWTSCAAQLEGSLPDDPPISSIAYEPVWAIGTGLTPTAADVAEMHRSIRDHARCPFWRGRGGGRASSTAARSIRRTAAELLGGRKCRWRAGRRARASRPRNSWRLPAVYPWRSVIRLRRYVRNRHGRAMENPQWIM